VDIETFLETASDEQKAVVEKIRHYADQERRLADRIEEIYAPYKREIDEISEMMHRQMAKFSRQNIYEQGMAAISKERQEFFEVGRNIAQQLERAVNLGMGELRFIRKHYEDYVDRSLT